MSGRFGPDAQRRRCKNRPGGRPLQLHPQQGNPTGDSCACKAIHGAYSYPGHHRADTGERFAESELHATNPLNRGDSCVKYSAGGESSLPVAVYTGLVGGDVLALLAGGIQRISSTEATGREPFNGHHSNSFTGNSRSRKEGEKENQLECPAGNLGADASEDRDSAAGIRADGDQYAVGICASAVEQIPV